MKINPMFAIDFYKVGHREQYPEGTEEIYSNFTPRYVKPNHNMLPDFDNKVVFFGLDFFVKHFLIDVWNDEFFSRKWEDLKFEYQYRMKKALLIDNIDVSHFKALHKLGYLPIQIKALPEGSRVPVGIPVLTISNTESKFFWLTNYLETVLSAYLWKPITSATTAFEFRRLCDRYARETGADIKAVSFQCHDFSFRGMCGLEDAALSGAAHLTSFAGTDSIPAIELIDEFYGVPDIGASVPATEHSVMCATAEEGELETIRRIITEIYPHGIVSVVADSYDFWRTLTTYIPTLKSDILSRNGKVVIRPDSGDPYLIICGDKTASIGTPAYKGALQCLWETFGGRVNEKGFRVLDPHVGLIYGDSITVEKAHKILEDMKLNCFESTNVVFGVGSYSYQYVTRDTFGFAVKATSAVINGERVEIFKDPKTGDGNKRSAKGLLHVKLNEDNEYVLLDQCDEMEEASGELKLVFLDGQLFFDETTGPSCFLDIRGRVNAELEKLYCPKTEEGE